MGFLSQYSGTVRINITEPEDPGGHWWVDVKKTLSGAELDIAEGKKLQVTQNMGDPNSGRAARERARKQLLGMPVEDDTPDDSAVNMNIDLAAYRLELLTLAIVEWNLTDERDQRLPLVPFDAKRRSIKRLPPEVYELLVARVEQSAATSKVMPAQDEIARFRGDSNIGGAY